MIPALSRNLCHLATQNLNSLRTCTKSTWKTVAAAATGEVAIEEAMVVLVLVVVVDTEEAMLGMVVLLMVVLASQEADVGIKEVLVVAASREEHHAVARGKCSGNISLSVYRSKQQLIRKSSA